MPKRQSATVGFIQAINTGVHNMIEHQKLFMGGNWHPPAIAEAVLEAELPSGVYNVVVADREASEYLVGHDGVDQVSFTGSTPVGRHV